MCIMCIACCIYCIILYCIYCCCTVKCPNFATFGLFADMLWERDITCQNVKVFGQANGTLKVFKLLHWLPGLPWKHKKLRLFSYYRPTGHENHSFSPKCCK